MELIKRGTAPWDKCQKLDPNQKRTHVERCVRWFTNQRFHKLVKQSDGFTRQDARDAIDKLMRFSSVVKPRKLFQEERSEAINKEAKKLTHLHQATRWSVAESQMWQKEDKVEWDTKAKAHYNVEQNQAELRTLLQLFLDALATSGHVGPVQAFMIVSTRDSDGHVDTGMVEAGSSKTEFIKT
ncbi:hypothetical protein AAF712_016861, partial [Marasmius tenuissimus]